MFNGGILNKSSAIRSNFKKWAVGILNGNRTMLAYLKHGRIVA